VGAVQFVDATRIVVERGNMEDGTFKPLEGLGENFEFLGHEPIDEYALRKFERSNQDSCINQKPVVDVDSLLRRAMFSLMALPQIMGNSLSAKIFLLASCHGMATTMKML
jgi:DNA-directed RNA polymerase beta subunit